MENELMLGLGNALSLMADQKADELLKPMKQEILLIRTYLSGFGRIEDQEPIDALKKGDPLVLRREEDFLDDYAILVLNEAGQPVGYVREKDNEILARLMDAGKRLTAQVRSVDRGGGDSEEDGNDIPRIRVSISMVEL